MFSNTYLIWKVSQWLFLAHRSHSVKRNDMEDVLQVNAL